MKQTPATSIHQAPQFVARKPPSVTRRGTATLEPERSPLASLVELMNGGPRQQAQLKVANRLQQSDLVQSQVRLAAEANGNNSYAGTSLSEPVRDSAIRRAQVPAFVRDSSVSLLRMSAPILQRMKIGKDTKNPDDVFDWIKNTDEAQEYIGIYGEQSLRAWLVQNDSQVFASKKALCSEIWALATGKGSTKKRYVEQARETFQDSLDIVLGPANAIEVLYKVQLLREIGEGRVVDIFARYVANLAILVKRRAPIDWPGLLKTFQIVTNEKGWGGDPSSLLTTGKEKVTGTIISFQGLISEMDAILGVDYRDLAGGEVVFSGSNYKDAEGKRIAGKKQPIAIDKDVDVSFIDSHGVLHLIEAAKDMQTLYNKLQANQEQRLIYQYLTTQSAAITHTAVGPLSLEQQQRNQISAVKWWYNVPPHAVEFDSEEAQFCLGRLIAFGAGLRSGGQTWEGEELESLRRKREPRPKETKEEEPAEKEKKKIEGEL